MIAFDEDHGFATHPHSTSSCYQTKTQYLTTCHISVCEDFQAAAAGKCGMQGRQASIWGLLNHLRLTHPQATVVGQPLDQQPVDRTVTSHEEACKPDRCSGAVVAATGGAPADSMQDVLSVGPHGSIRCISPMQHSHRPQQQQNSSRHAHIMTARQSLSVLLGRKVCFSLQQRQSPHGAHTGVHLPTRARTMLNTAVQMQLMSGLCL